MNIKIFGCKRFQKLSSDLRDRDLNVREERFLDRHRAVCSTCYERAESSSMALNMLRSCAIEPEVKPNFDERVMRRVRVQHISSSIHYWSPAIIGAGVAGLVILAALQMIAQSSRLPSISVPGGEARLVTPQFPNSLENVNYNRINQ